jgi:hypothetical protein
MALSVQEFRESIRQIRYWLAVSVFMNFLTLSIVVYIWNTSGGKVEYDALALSITTLEIILAIVAVGGFWMIRGAASESARERAEEVAREVAEKEARDVAEPAARRATEDFLSAKSDLAYAQADIDSLVDAIGKQGEGKNA